MDVRAFGELAPGPPSPRGRSETAIDSDRCSRRNVSRIIGHDGENVSHGSNSTWRMAESLSRTVPELEAREWQDKPTHSQWSGCLADSEAVAHGFCVARVATSELGAPGKGG